MLKSQKIPLDVIPCFVGGDGIIIERKNGQFNGTVYPVATQAKASFYNDDGNVRNTISIEHPDWKTPVITDITTSSEVPYTVKKQALVFKLLPGHTYLIH